MNNSLSPTQPWPRSMPRAVATSTPNDSTWRHSNWTPRTQTFAIITALSSRRPVNNWPSLPLLIIFDINVICLIAWLSSKYIEIHDSTYFNEFIVSLSFMSFVYTYWWIHNDCLCCLTGHSDQAVKQYLRAIELQPNHTVALVNAARTLRSMKHTKKAESLYKR